MGSVCVCVCRGKGRMYHPQVSLLFQWLISSSLPSNHYPQWLPVKHSPAGPERERDGPPFSQANKCYNIRTQSLYLSFHHLPITSYEGDLGSTFFKCYWFDSLVPRLQVLIGCKMVHTASDQNWNRERPGNEAGKAWE